jgi:fibronectin type 3 domain-containing protein
VKKFLALSFAVLAACGKRGDPHPPVPIIPQSTSDLVVSQRGPAVVLAWSYPSLTTAGKKLESVKRVVVYRYTEELPATQPPRDVKTIMPGDVDPTKPQAIALFSKVPGLTPAQFTKLEERIDSIESANLPAATEGAKLIYTDTPAFHTKDGRPVRLNYAIVTEGGTTPSAIGNVASLVPIDVPLPPSNVVATPKAEGVVLTWTAPSKSATSDAKPFVAGYNVYRVPKGATLTEVTAPVNAAPVTATTYTDVPPYGDFDYRVTAIAATSPRIESDPSPVLTATFKDLMPPPAPASITALVETKSVRLVWDPVDAPDLANYVVYRTEGIGHGEPKEAGTFAEFVLPAGTTTVVDKEPDPGIEYKYSVTAKDKSGNESKRTSTGWVLVPKAP